jgi:hypothetical protein
MQASVNLNLRHQFLFCSRLSKSSLCDNFGCTDSLSLKVCEFIALCKTSFTKEFASQVFLNADIAIEFDDLLFYNDLSIILHEIILATGTLRLLSHFLLNNDDVDKGELLFIIISNNII